MVRWSITANQKNLKNEKKKKIAKIKKKQQQFFSQKSEKKLHKITMAHECQI